MLSFLRDIRDWFRPKQEHLLAFARADCRLESWFKGELLVLFARLQKDRRITQIRREVQFGSGQSSRHLKVDFVLGLAEETHLCELKAPCISEVVTSRNLQFYFRENDRGLIRDFRKLDDVDEIHKWLLAFIYPRPDHAEWNRVVSKLPKELHHWKPVTSPSDASPELFVSLWQSRVLDKS